MKVFNEIYYQSEEERSTLISDINKTQDLMSCVRVRTATEPKEYNIQDHIDTLREIL